MRFIGKITLANCNSSYSEVVTGSSNLKILIYDEYVGQTDSNGKTVDAYPIQFSSASHGSMQNGTLTVTFKDSYGEITLSGTVNSQTYQGRMDFVNYKSYTGDTANRSGTLGNIEVMANGFISCK